MRQEFLGLLRPVYSDIERHCRALCSGDDRIAAEDILQDSLLKAYTRFGQLEDRSAFRAWLFRTVTRTYLSAQRRAFLRRTVSLELVSLQSHVDFNGLSDYETRDRLKRAFQALKPREKSALTLYHLSGFSVEEIAQLQDDRSLSATKSRLARGRQKLRKELNRLETPHLSRKADNLEVKE